MGSGPDPRGRGSVGYPYGECSGDAPRRQRLRTARSGRVPEWPDAGVRPAPECEVME